MTTPEDGSAASAASAFYNRLLRLMRAQRIAFLVGGAYAFAHYTGIRRPTKDLDVFIRRADWEPLARAAQAAGWRAELAFPHWLGKVVDAGTGGGAFVDVIFNSGNGLSPVEESWFDGAPRARIVGRPVRLMRVEECIWTKAFIMERERFDGADIAHLIHARAAQIDWSRLLRRFGDHWRVLLAHLVLFGFIYPGERDRVPAWLLDDLGERLRAETHSAPPCGAPRAGTLLSREQYLPDLEHKGYDDARLGPGSTMTPQDVAGWTAAITSPSPPPLRLAPDNEG